MAYDEQSGSGSPGCLHRRGDPGGWHSGCHTATTGKQSRDLKAISGFVTYGWGMVPVHARTGKTGWKASLWPKDSLRKAENLDTGDEVTIQLEVSK